MNQLAGKRALVTGAASGIGRATAELFACEGASVVLLDIDPIQGEQAAESIRHQGGKAAFIQGDVSRAEDCQRAVEAAAQQLGGIDVLFNNAGIVRRASVVDTTVEEWDRVIAVNLRSVFLMSKYVIPKMLEAGGGSIINNASGWGLSGGKDAASYCASKGGVVNLTRAMAIDHGPQKIRVNCICPGDTDTNMLRSEARQLEQNIDSFLVDSASRPLGRIAAPVEIAHAVLYLASDVSSFVTGSALVIDGGAQAY
jgi:NAD(P)-dependent dehydrogenase (short-subunit alcohol dehydrogenase family)